MSVVLCDVCFCYMIVWSVCRFVCVLRCRLVVVRCVQVFECRELCFLLFVVCCVMIVDCFVICDLLLLCCMLVVKRFVLFHLKECYVFHCVCCVDVCCELLVVSCVVVCC